jgi:hypothetical protein
MDIAGELLAIHRCLKTPSFRPGEAVRNGNGRIGRVISAKLSVFERGVGNEFQVCWEDGEVCWIDGDLLSRAGGEPPCLPTMNSSIA